MGVAFGMDADFRAMSSMPLFINSVRHKTFCEVNEEGTEAAAATSVEMALKAVPISTSVIIDRPFFLAIRDTRTGVVLFMGAVEDPG